MAHLGRVDIGDQAIFQAIFRDENKILRDPTDVTFSIQRPGGLDVTSTPDADISHPSTGVFRLRYLIPTDTTGTWHLKVVGTGALVSAEEATFEVKPTAF